MHAIRIHEYGGPEVLRWEEVEEPTPAEGEVLLRHTAVGLNFIDVAFREGRRAAPTPPFTPGMEGAGVVEAVGPGVTGIVEGDRVAYASPPAGAYAEWRVMPAARLVKVADGIDDETAAAMMLKGMTAQYLLRQTYPVQPGEAVLVHAAAGGVGSLLCQWARHLGATVIGNVGNDEKAELARGFGCEHPIVSSRDDIVARVREITGGAGVSVVYDSLGGETFYKSMDCLRPRGMLVSYGQSSGPIEPLDIGVLGAKGGVFVTRPSVFGYSAKREDMLAMAGEVMEMIDSGKLRIDIRQRYPLAEAMHAHWDLEARRTTGATVLLP
ncbi:MAG: quinone oxidoreductase [Aquisalimonadaceae bacterium]